jgi:membrane protein
VVRRLREARDRARVRYDREVASRPRLGGWIEALKFFLNDAKEDRVTGLAAEVAFYAILSLFPAVVALAAALGFLESLFGVDAADEVESTILDAVNRLFGSGASGLEEAIAGLFDQTSPGLLGVGLLLTVYTVSRAFNGLINALDVVYDIDETRSAVRTRALAVWLAVGSVLVAAIVLTMLVVGPAFGSGLRLADDVGLADEFTAWWDLLSVPLVVVALTLWAWVMFHVAPNHSTPWRSEIPGSLLTMCLWLLGVVGFRIYLEVASNGTNVVFGVLGGALTLLLWLYVMGLALLLGGELNAYLDQARAGRSGVAPPPTLAP